MEKKSFILYPTYLWNDLLVNILIIISIVPLTRENHVPVNKNPGAEEKNIHEKSKISRVGYYGLG